MDGGRNRRHQSINPSINQSINQTNNHRLIFSFALSPFGTPTTTQTPSDDGHAASSALALTVDTRRALAWMDEAAMAACGVTTGEAYYWWIGLVVVGKLGLSDTFLLFFSLYHINDMIILHRREEILIDTLPSINNTGVKKILQAVKQQGGAAGGSQAGVKKKGGEAAGGSSKGRKRGRGE